VAHGRIGGRLCCGLYSCLYCKLVVKESLERENFLTPELCDCVFSLCELLAFRLVVVPVDQRLKELAHRVTHQLQHQATAQVMSLEGSTRKYNPCGKRRNHSNSDKLGKAKYQALAVGIFCRGCEHPYNLLVGGVGN